MKVEKVYAAETRYGVVTRKMKGVIVVGETDLITAKDEKSLNTAIKEMPVADVTKPLFESITDKEELKRYCDYNKITVDKRLSLDDMRKAVREDTELKEKIDAEKSDISITR